MSGLCLFVVFLYLPRPANPKLSTRIPFPNVPAPFWLSSIVQVGVRMGLDLDFLYDVGGGQGEGLQVWSKVAPNWVWALKSPFYTVKIGPEHSDVHFVPSW